MSMFIYFYQWFLPSSYYHLFLWTNDPSPPGVVWAVGQAASMSVTCKKPQRTLKTKGAMMTMTMMKVMRLVAPRRGMFGGRFEWGIGMVLSLNLQFYHSSVIFRIFTLHEKWVNRIPLRVPMIPLAHVSNQDSTCNTLQQHVQSTLT